LAALDPGRLFHQRIDETARASKKEKTGGAPEREDREGGWVRTRNSGGKHRNAEQYTCEKIMGKPLISDLSVRKSAFPRPAKSVKGRGGLHMRN